MDISIFHPLKITYKCISTCNDIFNMNFDFDFNHITCGKVH
jgi:hypothetical protein